MNLVIRVALEVVLICPVILLAFLGITALRRHPVSERWTGVVARTLLSISFLAALVATFASLGSSEERVWLDYGPWLEAAGQRIEFIFVFDSLSCILLLLSTGMCSVVASFGHRYLHREPGYHRFFSNFALFALGIDLIAVGGSLEVAVVGWEFLGISSALLVAYFHDRPLPVKNGLRIFAVYRVSDLGLIFATVLVHQQIGTTEFRQWLEAGLGNGENIT